MGDGFQFFDIILFALIAAFLILRLRNTLGRRDGNDGKNYRDPFTGMADKPAEPHKASQPDDDDNVIPLPGHKDAQGTDPWASDEAAPVDDSPLGQGVAQIRAADPSFTVDGFLQGAGSAFEMVLGAFAAGDVKTLKGLLSPEVYEDFAAAVRQREDAGEVLEETLVGITSAEAVEAYMEGRIANVTVKFVTEQVSALRNVSGDVIDGNPQEVIKVTDFWTFARDTRSRDPNWALVATRSLD